MAAEINQSKAPSQKDAFDGEEGPQQRDLDRLADNAAKRGEEEEQHYDQDHDIFTK